MKTVLEYTEEPLVSRDIIGNPHSCIFDASLTNVIDKRLLKVVGWYDNEWGYSKRMVDLLKLMASLK
jgi:glyceraldehyde 3-phosphate dehydrogenase